MNRLFKQDDPDAPGWPRGFVVAQAPNAPLALALAAAVLGRFVDGRAADIARAVFYVALAAWAYEEAAHGVNWFRRLLGAGVLVYVVVRVADRFGG